MRYLLFLIACVLLLIVHTPAETPRPGGLEVMAPTDVSFAGHVEKEGTGNFQRVLAKPGSKSQPLLELASGSEGKIAYVKEAAFSPDATAKFRVQFLSTQGTGLIVLEALDASKRPIAAIEWQVTGSSSREPGPRAVINKRMNVNFRGDWIEEEWDIQRLLKEQVRGFDSKRTESYRLRIVAGQGQHVLISDALFTARISGSIRITPLAPLLKAELGEQLTIAAEVENIGREPLSQFTVGLWRPYAFGVVVEGPQEFTVPSLSPGGKEKLVWQVRAQRPDLVNLGRPWQSAFTINGQEQGVTVSISVSDNRPGKLFYVMTEDLEPIDSAGYAKAWGNADGWLNPQEYRVQLIGKAEKLNQIAEKYGAKWTHYIAWPSVRAAEWASERSAKSDWKHVVQAICESVKRQSAKGHEYALHLHSDYDPDLADNVLSYNAETDGLWANHRRHGWAHSVLREGSFDLHESRVGMLYSYQKVLDYLTQDSGAGQIITARVGSFDFGDGDDDEAMSTRAYKKVGLWGSSDADGNRGGLTSAPYGKEIYLARFDDINVPAESPETAGLVEFRPTPQENIMYDLHTAAILNAKADAGVAYFTANGQIKPGVHSISGFTHAMFMMGDADWQSLDGGQFASLDQHLRYLKENYADKNLLTFATASELVAEYLDYYTPVPVALYGQKKQLFTGAAEYEIRILGKDIPINTEHRHQLHVKLPLYLRDSAFFVQVLKNGETIYSTWEAASENNDIPFVADDKNAQYTLKVYYDEELAELRRKTVTWWNRLVEPDTTNNAKSKRS